MKTLTEILDSHGSDKGFSSGDRHNYGAVYGTLFACRRADHVQLLEFGVANGSSVLAWLEFFPHGDIYGVDQDLTALSSGVPKDHPRLHLIEGDATDPEVVPNRKYDVIIDDSNHVTKTQVSTLLAHWEKLGSGGLYIIEDLFVGELPWGGKSSDRSFSFLWPYSGYHRSPPRRFFPRHPQDLFVLNRIGMTPAVRAILDGNEHFVTISSVSTDGGLHMMLVIRRGAL